MLVTSDEYVEIFAALVLDLTRLTKRNIAASRQIGVVSWNILHANSANFSENCACWRVRRAFVPRPASGLEPSVFPPFFVRHVFCYSCHFVFLSLLSSNTLSIISSFVSFVGTLSLPGFPYTCVSMIVTSRVVCFLWQTSTIWIRNESVSQCNTFNRPFELIPCWTLPIQGSESDSWRGISSKS